MVTPDGQPFSGEWYGGQGFYRLGKGVKVSARALEGAILDRVFDDLSAPDVAFQPASQMRAQAAPQGKPRDLDALRHRLASLERKVARLVDLVAEDSDAAPAYRRAIAQMETDRAAVQDELEQSGRERETAALVTLWTPADVQRLLDSLREDLQAGVAAGELADVRHALSELIESVEYDTQTRRAGSYRLNTGVKMASPGGVEPPSPP